MFQAQETGGQSFCFNVGSRGLQTDLSSLLFSAITTPDTRPHLKQQVCDRCGGKGKGGEGGRKGEGRGKEDKRDWMDVKEVGREVRRKGREMEDEDGKGGMGREVKGSV